jgi:HD-GYP domain-containing protein (c-di-GMP phosphodiesterase class II)
MNASNTSIETLRRIGACTLVLLGMYTVVNISLAVSGGHPLPAWVHGGAVLVAGAALWASLGASRSAGREPEPLPERDPEDYLETVRMLAAAIDTGDPFALGRSYRVAQFCLRVGAHLKLSADRLRTLELAALLHDIGRTAIHRDVLLKPGRLDAAEREAVRTHPQIGYEILRGIEPLRRAAEIVRAHHEQPDGRGYPSGLAASQIPLESSIISAVAAFEAMTCDRPYRRALSAAEALEEMREHAGRQFRAEVVEALQGLHESGDLYAGMDLVSLERYSSGRCVSRAVEEHLARHKIPWGGSGWTGQAPPAVQGGDGEIGIELVTDGQILLDEDDSDRFSSPPRASGQ